MSKVLVKGKKAIIPVGIIAVIAIIIVYVLLRGSVKEEELVKTNVNQPKEIVKTSVGKVETATDTAKAIGVDKEGLEYGKDWVELKPEEKAPADPNKKLPSGITLGELRYLIDVQRQYNKEDGMTEAESKEMLEQIAKDMGSSLEEVNRVPVSKTTNPSTKSGTTTNTGTKSNTTTKSNNNTGTKSSTGTSTNTGAKVGTPGAFPKTDWDKNGNGIKDSLEQSYIGGDGLTTSSDPNFRLGFNGESATTSNTDSSKKLSSGRKLSSGITLGELKSLIDTQRRYNKEDGLTEAESKKMLEQIAKDMGSTLEEVDGF